MAVRSQLHLASENSFLFEFQIKEFTETPTLIPEQSLRTRRGSGVFLSVQGKGTLAENRDFVVFRIRKGFDSTDEKYFEESAPATSICNCILNILDAEGHKRFPRTFPFVNDAGDFDVHEERYIERSCILNNALEYLQGNTLTVIVEGTMEGWGDSKWPAIPHWFFSTNIHVEQHEHGLEVYIPNDCVHANSLLTHSTVFRRMMRHRMLETNEERIRLRNEELPAFLCMLFFIEFKKLIFHGTTVSDLYKIAHMYDIPILLEECRIYIAKYLPRNASAILEFASFYDDAELMRTAEDYIESHSHETQERSDTLEMGSELGGFNFVCDIRPVCSNLINTVEDFEGYLKSLWGKIATDSFLFEFQINEFTESPILIPEQFLRTGRYSGVLLSVQGKGTLAENRDSVVFRVREDIGGTDEKYCEESAPATLICSCILSILDVEGHKRFTRTLSFVQDSGDSRVHEERYLERSCILNDAPQYLQEDTLAVIVEGTIENWDESKWPAIPYWFPSKNFLHFHVEQLEHGLKVYLFRHSVHTRYLLEHSKVFCRLYNVPMLESATERILLRNDELPAFLCMLFFIETQQLILHGITIFDLYKIADKYDIQVLIEKCRQYIARHLPENASAVLEFATFYDDAELMRAAEAFAAETPSHETRERDGDFIWDALSASSNLINTDEDFEKYLKNLWEKIVSDITSEYVDHITLSETRTDSEEFAFYH